MDRLKNAVKKELDQIAEQGLTSTNLDTTFKLVDILKDIGEIEEDKKERGEYGMRYPREGTRNVYMPIYRERGNYEYNGRMYGNEYMDDGYGRMNGRGGGNYRHTPMEHLFDKLNRILEHMEEYIDGKDRYHAGAHPGHMTDGLEKTMYAVCTLVESLMDCAETPEEKETVRKHIEKIKNI